MSRRPNSGIRRRLAVGVITWLTWMVFPNLARTQSEEEAVLQFRDNVVRIVAEYVDQKIIEGFGFIVGKASDKIYVVTANHTVRSPDDPSATLRRIIVRFRNGESEEGVLLDKHLPRPK